MATPISADRPANSSSGGAHTAPPRRVVERSGCSPLPGSSGIGGPNFPPWSRRGGNSDDGVRDRCRDAVMNDHQRVAPPHHADERSTLTAMLRFQRDTLAMTCAGLTPEQLKDRAIAPSGLSLLGLVRHAAEVERGWFRNVMDGEASRSPWTPAGSADWADFDFDFDVDVDDADVEEAFAVWRDEGARARAVVDAAESLDVLGGHDGETYSLRYVLAHMIEEYARHNGHADLLRERIDGATGE